MLLRSNKALWGTAGLLAALAASPAVADVKAGVDAWSRGDFAVAVREWQAPAEAGDPDAMFNLAQAYRLGRGVQPDLKRAEALYAKAAGAGHLQAADTYGLMLFQDGRRAAALPYVRDAARRGDPRAQYLLGIAHFNGDGVERDWVRAYALMTLASTTGLAQAGPALAEMDRNIPFAQRQQAASLAVQLRSEAQASLSRDLAAAELGTAGPAPAAAPAAEPRVPQPLAVAAVPPSAPAARSAVAEAARATGTESPAAAGASYTLPSRSGATAAPPAPAPRQAAAIPPPAVTASPPAARPAVAAMTGPWRVQLGAFSVAGNAEQLWGRLKGRPELAGSQKLMVPAGKVTRLLAGGFPSRAAAETACRALQRTGQDCLVTDR